MSNLTQSCRESTCSATDLNIRSNQEVNVANRELFHNLIHVEDYPGALPYARKKIDDLLARLNQGKRNTATSIDDQNVDIFFGQIDRWLQSGLDTDSKSLRFPLLENHIPRGELGEIIKSEESINDKESKAFRLLAPSLLLQPCWLQNTGQANIAHTPASALLFRIYSASLGYESRKGLNRHQIHLVLQKQGVPMPQLEHYASIIKSGIPDWAFAPPALYLCLCQNLRTLFPEVLGFTLAHMFTPLPIRYPWLFRAIDTHEISLLANLQETPAEDKNNILKAIETYRSSESKTARWKRIQSGFKLYVNIHSELTTNIEKYLAQHLTLQHEVISIFRRKAIYAAGHHRDLKLGGRSLDEWFRAKEFDGDTFLKELFNAGYFDRKSPYNSPFLKQLITFDGPMFGVFTKQEVNTIVDWLTNLHTNQPIQTDDFFEKPPPFQQGLRQIPAVTQNYTARELFYSLLNIDHYPEILPVAKKRIKRVLAGTNRSIVDKNTDLLGLAPYSHKTFEKRIQTLYQKEITKYQRFKSPPKIGKKVYKWGILQLAPTILVDGCWLQNIARVDCWDSQINSKLFQIQADEIGSGIPEQNHPNVYRKLLKSLEIFLPEVDSQAFAQHPDFLDTAFDIPNYLLAISQFPKTFLPEIIGLNLAIELGGLGTVYQRLVDELEFWEIDSQIIRLHISIDNLSSGHSAIAVDVIMLYLDKILNQHGYDAMQESWERIRTGYNALKFVTRRFKLAILWQYSTRMLLPEIARLSVSSRKLSH